MFPVRRRNILVPRIALLVLCTFASLILAVLVPMVIHRHGALDPSLATTSYAAEIDLTSGGMPIVLNTSPRLVLTRGWLVHDPRSEPKDAPRLNLSNAEFVLDLTAVLNPVVPAAPVVDATADVGVSLYDKLAVFGFETLTIRNGTLRINYSTGTETISAIDADISGRKKGLISSKGAMVLRGQKVTFDATTGLPVESSAKAKLATKKMPLQATVTGSLFSATFDGRMETTDAIAFVGTLDATVPNLRDTVQWLGVTLHPSAFAEPFGVKSQFKWASRQMSFEKAAIQLNGQIATGTLSIGSSMGRPSVDATLAFQSLDLTQFVTASMPVGQTVEQFAQGWQGADIAWPIARQIDADFRLSSAKVSAGGAPLGRGAATISMKTGRLNIDIAELSFKGSPINAQVAVDMVAPTPTYNVRGKFELADLGPVAALILGRDFLSGAGAITVDLNGQGARLGDVLDGANGRLTVRALETMRIGADLKSVRAQAQIQGRDRPAVGWGVVAKSATAIDQADVRISLQDGVAEIDHGALKSGNQWLVTKGRVDLRRQSLDLLMAFRPVRAQERTPRPVEPREADLIAVTGPWSEPALRLVEAAPPP
jgi:AsmA protein